jgi:hypothetical protein
VNAIFHLQPRNKKCYNPVRKAVQNSGVNTAKENVNKIYKTKTKKPE